MHKQSLYQAFDVSVVSFGRHYGIVLVNKKAAPNAMRLECHNTDSVSNWPIDSECEYNKTGAECLLSEHAIFPLLSLVMLTQNANSK